MSLTDDITDPRLAKALAHPLRVDILRHLGDRTASPSEIAAEIGAPLTNVSYHVRKLRSLGLIKLVKKTPKRGVIEHYYSAQPRTTVTDEAWAATPDIVKEALVTPHARRAAEEMMRSIAAGGFNRYNSHFARQTNKLDQQGWDESSKLLHKLYDDLSKVEQEAIARMDASGAEPIQAGLLIAFYETVGLPAAAGGPPVGGSSAGAKRKRARADA